MGPTWAAWPCLAAGPRSAKGGVMTRWLPLLALALTLTACGGDSRCSEGAVRCSGTTLQSCDAQGHCQPGRLHLHQGIADVL
jgi:hypothetical protein